MVSLSRSAPIERCGPAELLVCYKKQNLHCRLAGLVSDTRPALGGLSPMGLVSRSNSRAASQPDWREVAVVAIKVVHSGIFLVNATSVLYIFWVGVLNRRSRWTRLALVAALTESIVFVANRGRCPLTQLVEAMGAESGRVSDIFLPRWLADRIPQLVGPPLVGHAKPSGAAL